MVFEDVVHPGLAAGSSSRWLSNDYMKGEIRMRGSKAGNGSALKKKVRYIFYFFLLSFTDLTLFTSFPNGPIRLDISDRKFLYQGVQKKLTDFKFI